MTRDLPTPARALAVAAHPDDAEFGCGGTLAKWASSGCEVSHLVLTDGSKGSWDPAQPADELVSVREGEQRTAAAVVRRDAPGEVHFLGWVDGELVSGLEQRERVAWWIRRLRPDVVLGHDPWKRYRLHPDHRHAGFLVTDGTVAARDPHFFPEHDVAPHRPRALLLWESDAPDHVEDISRFVDVKLDALLAHRSQHTSTMGITSTEGIEQFRRRMTDRAARDGRRAGVAHGEAFKLIGET